MGIMDEILLAVASFSGALPLIHSAALS